MSNSSRHSCIRNKQWIFYDNFSVFGQIENLWIDKIGFEDIYVTFRELDNINGILGDTLDPGGVRHEIRPIRMRHLQSDFRARKEPFWEVYVVKFSLYSKLVLEILTLYRRGKLLQHFIMIAVALL